MTTIASYEEVKDIIASVYSMKTIDDADKLIEIVKNNKNFHNEHNLSRICDYIGDSLRVNVNYYEAIIYALHKFVEEFSDRFYALDHITFLHIPEGCNFEIHYPDGEIEFHYVINVNLNHLKKDSIIVAYKDNKVVLTIKIIDVVKSTYRQEAFKIRHDGKIDYPSGVKVKFTFNDYSSISMDCELTTEITNIQKAIDKDDVYKLQEILAIEPTLVDSEICELIHDNYRYDIKEYLKPLEYAMLKGSIECFKNILLNYEYKRNDEPNYIFSNYIHAFESSLIFGGNLEMLRIVEYSKLEINTRDIFRAIIIKHDFDLFMYWWLHHECEDIDDLIMIAVSYCNYDVLEFLNSQDEIKASVDKYFSSGARKDNLYLEFMIHFGYSKYIRLYNLGYRYIKFFLMNDIPYTKTDDDYANILYKHVDDFSNMEEIKYILNKIGKPKNMDKVIKVFMDHTVFVVRKQLYEVLKIIDFDVRVLTRCRYRLNNNSFMRWYTTRSAKNIDPLVILYFHEINPEFSVNINSFWNTNKRNHEDSHTLKIYALLESLGMLH